MLDDYNIDKLFREQSSYMKVLELMNDNADGFKGAFSIQNIARMGLVYNKYPGEWHGPGSISNVVKDLNKLYLPVGDFRILHFCDGMIYYDKIEKAAMEEPRNYLFDLFKRQDLSDEKLSKLRAMHILF